MLNSFTLDRTGAPVSINTLQQQSNMSIKSEPISPPRDATTPTSQHLRPPSSHQVPGHVSPNPMSNHSNSSSPIANGGSDYDGPSIAKRSRMAPETGWTTASQCAFLTPLLSLAGIPCHVTNPNNHSESELLFR